MRCIACNTWGTFGLDHRCHMMQQPVFWRLPVAEVVLPFEICPQCGGQIAPPNHFGVVFHIQTNSIFCNIPTASNSIEATIMLTALARLSVDKESLSQIILEMVENFDGMPYFEEALLIFTRLCEEYRDSKIMTRSRSARRIRVSTLDKEN